MSSLRLSMAVVAACLLALLSVACGPNDECKVDADCPKGQACKPSNGRVICIDPLSPPCSTSKDCPASKSKCDSLNSKCVQCLDDSDCSGTSLCKQRVCTDPNGCKQNSDCPSASPVCDTASSKCVVCLQDSECLAPQVCRQSLCVSPSIEPRSEPRTEVQAEPQTEPRFEAQAEVRPEPRSEPQPEPKPEPPPEPKPEPRPEPRPEPPPERIPDAGAEKLPEARPEPRPEIRPEPRPEIRPEPRPEIRPEPRPEVRPEVLPEPPPCTAGSIGCPCTAALSCNAGLLCFSTDAAATQNFCFQDCSQDATLCSRNTDGRTACVEAAQDAQGNPISLCFRDSLKNQSCDLNKSYRCKSGQTPPLYCSQTLQPNVCLESLVQTKENDPCTDASNPAEPTKVCDPKKQADGTILVCRQGLCKKEQPIPTYGACGGTPNKGACNPTDSCVKLSDTKTFGYCLNLCPTAGQPCGPNNLGECIALQSGEKVCLYGEALEDGLCGDLSYGSTAVNPKTTCSRGLTCITFASGSIVGSCLRIIPSCQAGACFGTNRLCLSLQDGRGVCTRSCTSNAGCTADHTCEPFSPPSSICVPQDKGGSLAYGALCDPAGTEPASRCCNRSGLAACTAGGRLDYDGLCITEQNATAGICSANCTTANDCPVIAGRTSQCTNIGNGSVCLITCTSTATCPTGTSCKTITGLGSICLAP